MASKGRESNAMGKKVTVQQRKGATVEKKKAEAKNVVSSHLKPTTLDHKKQDKNKPQKPASPSKVPPNRRNNVSPNPKERNLRVSKTKPKDLGKSHPLPSALHGRNSTNVKKDTITKQPRQPTKGLKMDAEKKKSNSSSSSSEEEDQNTQIHEREHDDIKMADDILIFEENDDKQDVDLHDDDLLHGEIVFEDGGEIPLGEPSPRAFGVDQDATKPEITSPHTIDSDEDIEKHREHDEETSDVASNNHDPKVDEETQELETENVSEAAEHGNEPTSSDVQVEDKDQGKEEPTGIEAKENLGELEAKDQGKEEPTGIEAKEDLGELEAKDQGKEEIKEKPTSNMPVKNQHGKKDNGAYNDVIEETASKLREHRRNKVKALVGAFETVISLENDV